MENINFYKPVIDLEETGKKIKYLRKASGYSVRDIQNVFGFEYPQAVYAWEQGKNIPSIDNLLVLSKLFGVSIEQLIISQTVEVELCNSGNPCKPKLSA